MFDRKSFISHHLTENTDKSGKNYSGFVLDYEGKQWGYIAEEGLYEAVNTGQKLNFAQFQNRQVDALTAEGGPAGAGAPTEHCFAGIMTLYGSTGNAVGGVTAGDHFTLRSAQGTSRTYVIIDDNASGATNNVTTGTTLISASDIGSTTIGAHAPELIGGIGVAVNTTGTLSTTAALFSQIKIAVEGSTGHHGEIMVSAVTAAAAREQSLVFTQAFGGANGNTDITEKAKSKLKMTDGDAAIGACAGDALTITSTDGTAFTYVLSDTSIQTNDAANGTLIGVSSGIGRTGGMLHGGANDYAGATLSGGIAVAARSHAHPSGTAMTTQRALLVNLKAAIEGATAHNGKILVGVVDAQVDGSVGMTLEQAATGVAGQTPIGLVGFEEIGNDLENTLAFRFLGAGNSAGAKTDLVFTKFDGGKGPGRNSQVIGFDIGATAAPGDAASLDGGFANLIAGNNTIGR